MLGTTKPTPTNVFPECSLHSDDRIRTVESKEELQHDFNTSYMVEKSGYLFLHGL